jgi:hypothetical protein
MKESTCLLICAGFCILLLLSISDVTITTAPPYIGIVNNTKVVYVERVVNKTIYMPVYAEIVPPFMRLDNFTEPELDRLSDRLWGMSGESAKSQYVAMVEVAIENRMDYKNPVNGAEILNPKDAWRSHVGDCSEYALIAEYMLKRKGINATYVWGNAYFKNGTDAGLHARTHVEYDIDANRIGNFTQGGSGLYLGEKVI